MFKIKDEIGRYSNITKDLYIEVDRGGLVIFIRESDEPDGSVPRFPESFNWFFPIPTLGRSQRSERAQRVKDMVEAGLWEDEIAYSLKWSEYYE